MSVLAPLLRPASWRLSPGAADVPWLRRLALVLLLTSALALLCWCVATWLESWRYREFGWASVLAVPLCGFGLRHAWMLAASWIWPAAPITLRWTGPVVTGHAGAPAGGWRVEEWGSQPVDVSLVWDWQRVLLLRVSPCERGSCQAWIWLRDHRDTVAHQTGEVHRLRTLVCLPASMTRPPLSELSSGRRSAKRAGLMASSQHEPPVAPVRMMGSPARSARQARRESDAVCSAPLRLQDDFPATQVLERWSNEACAPQSLNGGRP